MDFGDSRYRSSFWDKVIPEPMTGCWLWLAYLNEDGYAKGRDHRGAPGRLIHKVLYETINGLVSEGLELDHKCRVRCCVNSDHLEAVTHQVNIQRGEGVGQGNAIKTHCPKGHPYDERNTYISKNALGGPARRCRACQREASQRYRDGPD